MNGLAIVILVIAVKAAIVIAVAARRDHQSVLSRDFWL